MLFELWHHWMLLRPLLVFVLAMPLLVFAVLVRGRGEPRGSEGKADAAPAAAGAAADGHPGQEAEVWVEACPRQWQLGAGGADRRAA